MNKTLIIPNVDLDMLDKQRLALVDLLNEYEHNHVAYCLAKSDSPRLKEQILAVQGILNMLDDWSDNLNTDDGKYVKAGGTLCPSCNDNGISIEGTGVDVSDGGAIQEMWCNRCGAKWDDVYVLSGIANLRRIKL